MAITGYVAEKKGKYYAVLNLYDEDGKRKPKWIPTHLSVRGNKKSAERFLNDTLTEWNNRKIPYRNMLVSAYFELWLREVETEVRKNTYRNYCGNMRNHIIPYFKTHDVQLQELAPCHLNAYYKKMRTSSSKLGEEGALSPASIKHHHQNISKALSDAVTRGLIAVNPAKGASPPGTRGIKGAFLGPSQIEELKKLYVGTPIELPVALCAFYGFRRSECLGLRWEHVNFEIGTITIVETLQQHSGGNYVDETKTDQSYRTLPMTDSIREMLLEKKARQDRCRNKLGEAYSVSDYVCTWDDGKVISPNYLTKQFHKVIAKSDLPHIRLHDLRHSAASNLLNMGFSVVQVAEWLGHSSPGVTLRFYSRVDITSKLGDCGGIGGEAEGRLKGKK